MTFETDEKWISEIEKLTTNAKNVTILKAPSDSSQKNYVATELEDIGEKFDVIIIDGMQRSEMFLLAMNYLNDDGLVICDNADGYGFYEAWQQFSNFLRIDFYGHAPGTIHPHLTSIIFDRNCRFVNINNPIYSRKYQDNEMPYLS